MVQDITEDTVSSVPAEPKVVEEVTPASVTVETKASELEVAAPVVLPEPEEPAANYALGLDVDLELDPEEKFAAIKVKEDKKVRQDKPVKAKESDEVRKKQQDKRASVRRIHQEECR
ncbi:hypothetical protein [Methylocucumis oryzae]|uniref:Uncharacterized protein n=1 Tax=Methylocucumis oryzae TaxID=1632867 RepID=A0A0F3IK84_9GAMM|nr:hypothetical protein [Methylocucumis oryzae]KJV07072.1 hypothetical protein VZ94_07190 [Methylocucumis oryzae]